jgi:Right handed beta helix region
MSTKDKTNLIFHNKTYTNVTLRFLRCRNVTFTNCSFRNASLYFTECNNVTVQRCSFMRTNTTHVVQCDKTNNITISRNYFEEPIGTSKAVDIINMYKSNNAVISRNYLKGGGPHKSGGGIILGDNMGDNQEASYNICIDCGQYGMAIAGGANNRIIHNTIMSRRYSWTNVGLYVWGIPQRGSRVTNAIVTDNTISWKNKENRNNPLWISSQNVTGTTAQRNRLNVPYAPPSRPINTGAV